MSRTNSQADSMHSGFSQMQMLRSVAAEIIESSITRPSLSQGGSRYNKVRKTSCVRNMMALHVRQYVNSVSRAKRYAVDLFCFSKGNKTLVIP